MIGRSSFFSAFLAATLLAFAPASSRAESSTSGPLDRRLELALEAYNNLEMDRAVEILEEAIQVARIEGITGELTARLQVTLGTVLVLGFNRLADGRDQLVAARRESREVEPDEMLSTPLLDQLWQDVITEMGEPAGSGSAGDDGGEVTGDEPLTFGHGRVIPIPVHEQLPDHAVPIYVETQQIRDVRRVLLAYRGDGNRRFLSIEMDEHHGGYAGRIPCHRVRPPRVEYFVTVLDSRGEIVASAGSEEEPLVVEIREELEGREPSLPNEDPEPHCSEDSVSQEQEEQALPSNQRRLMFVEAGIGTGAGIPIARGQERSGCINPVTGGEVFDLIQVNSSLSWTELVLAPAVGFDLLDNLTLGLRGRLQFAGAVFPGAPHVGAVLAELRFLPVAEDPVRFFLQFGLGAGGIIHPILLEGATNCGEYYYRRASTFLGQVGMGVFFDVHPLVALTMQLNFIITAPTMVIQGDLTFGLNISIPRR